MSITYYLQNAFSNRQLEQEKIEQIEKAIAAFNNNKITDYLIENKCSHTGNYQDDIYHLILFLNKVIMGYGIEPINDRDIANAYYDNVDAVKYGNCIADYINTGDTYSITILYDRLFDRLLVTTMGDYVEEIDNIKAIATEIENLVDSGVIEWDEWVEDNTIAFPIRLQKCDRVLTLFYGTPDFDYTHAGFWGYYSICPDNTDYLEIAIDLYDQCLGMEWEANRLTIKTALTR